MGFLCLCVYRSKEHLGVQDKISDKVPVTGLNVAPKQLQGAEPSAQLSLHTRQMLSHDSCSGVTTEPVLQTPQYSNHNRPLLEQWEHLSVFGLPLL